MHINNDILNPRCWLLHLEKPLYPLKLAAVFIAAAIASIVMLGWIYPNFAAKLPLNWYKMQATTALPLLLLSISLGLKITKKSINTWLIQRALLAFSFIILCTIFYEHLNNDILILGKHLVAGIHSQKVHMTSTQSALSLLLITVLLSMNEKCKGLPGYTMCTLLALLVLLVISFVLSYLFGAENLLTSRHFSIISTQTLICIMLLTAVIITLRGPYSAFSVIFSTSLGGQFARRFLTIAMAMLLLVMSLETLLKVTQRFNSAEINTITLTANIILMFFIIIIAANRIEKQALQLEEQALTDKLTDIYNLKGLYLHAEQKLLDAQRHNAPLSVLMFDLDGLKEVNDRLGHETGSRLIKSFATSLNNNYRANDIVARIGGDEFVVIAMSDEKEVQLTLDRLAEIINDLNTYAKHPFKISYSVGIAALQPNSTETIDSLIKAADIKMYAAKKTKKDKNGI